VYGLNKTKGIKEWSVPLDERLLHFEIMGDASYVAPETDWNIFFRTMTGVTRSPKAQIEKVILRFHNGRENYFKTKPFLPDYEEFFEEEKKDQVWFEAIINKELVQELLSFGGDLEVLSPEVLRIEMRLHAASLQKYYFD
jgi:predicted DNA-binding transcriptional regulator YafY